MSVIETAEYFKHTNCRSQAGSITSRLCDGLFTMEGVSGVMKWLVFSLPLYPTMREGDVEVVIHTVREVLSV